MQCRKAIAAKTTKFHVTVIHPTRDRFRHFIDFGSNGFWTLLTDINKFVGHCTSKVSWISPESSNGQLSTALPLPLTLINWSQIDMVLWFIWMEIPGTFVLPQINLARNILNYVDTDIFNRNIARQKKNKTSDKIRGDDAYLNVLFIIMEIGA